MNDQWISSLPSPPSQPNDPLPPANSWSSSDPCTIGPDQPSFTYGIILTGSPATISAMPWQITLNDGGGPPNFTIDHYDASGNLIDHPLEFSGVDGSATFNDPVFMQAASAYSLQVTNGPLSVPDVSALSIPGGPIGSYLGSASPTGLLTWFNLPPPVIASDAPTDGQLYGRQSSPAGTTPVWTAVGVGTGFLPLTGGTMSGGIYFNTTNGLGRFVAGLTSNSLRWAVNIGDSLQETGGNAGSNLTIQNFSDTGGPLGTPFTITRATGAVTLSTTPGVNPLAINGASGTWRSIVGTTNGSTRWQMFLGNPTGELGSNFGSNFQLSAYSDAGAQISTPLQIARATGVATFSALPSFPGGTSGQFLSTNGSGTLSWGTITIPPPVIPTDAPTDGQQYARQSVPSGTAPQWVPFESGPPTTISDTPPANPAVGQLWWDSVGGQLYVFYNDGSSSQWVIAVNAASTGSVQIGTLPPANPSIGQLWWDNVGAQLYVWYNDGNSSQWVPTTNQLGGGYLQKQGVTDGSDAPPGQIGEVISSIVGTPGNGLPSNTVQNVTSISLTPGDWDVQGEVWITTGTGGATALMGAISPVSGSIPVVPSALNSARANLNTTLSAGTNNSVSLSPCRVSVSVVTPYYLVAFAIFPSGTTLSFGKIWARRAR